MLLPFLINNLVIIGLMYIRLNLPNKIMKKSFLLNPLFYGLMSTIIIMNPFNYEELIFDLRAVPIIFATYCYGWKVGAAATLLPISYRYLYLGGLSTEYIIITIIVHFFIPIVVSHYFHKRDKINESTFLLKKSLIMISVIYFIVHFVVGAIVKVVHLPLLTTISSILLFFTLVSLLFISFMRSEDIKSALIQLKMVKSEKMEVVSHLAASISHEVRNPLTVVKGFLQLLKQDIPEQKRTEFIDLSIQEIDRANDIIANYLTFAKPAPENMTLLNMNDELQRTVSIIKPMANMASVELELKAEDNYIQGESQLLQQSLLNIIKNCIEAMPKGGYISLDTKREGDSLVVVIKDNGKGMSEDQLSRLGEPYFTTKDEGTGLGMMTAIRIIESLQGKIEVTSHLDKGTVFTLYFPIIEQKANESA